MKSAFPEQLLCQLILVFAPGEQIIKKVVAVDSTATRGGNQINKLSKRLAIEGVGEVEESVKAKRRLPGCPLS